ncbi:MAG: histidinol-phosphatase HisJ family protein [Clostridia bacterium]|nr:histidinol-phosphatase HisJ family protein [Clostridia bacterium]
MIYPVDMHLHSTFSCDATSTMEQHVQDALQKGLKAVCFTEHVDYNPNDEGIGYYNYEAVTAEVERLRERYGGGLLILKGIEFSEPHLYPKEFEAFTKKDYDYILASVHFLDDAFVLSHSLIEKNTPEELFDRYYKEVEACVRFGGFDGLAHMDYLRRGIGHDLYSNDVLLGIFSLMVKNNIVLEINSQNLRRGIEESFPNPKKIKLYREAGGSKIVLGSDGHHPGDLASGIEKALDACSDIQGLIPGYFVKRRFISI